jgi:hypothetical protein
MGRMCMRMSRRNPCENADPMGQSIQQVLVCIGAIITCIVAFIKCLITRSPLACGAAWGSLFSRFLEHGSPRAPQCVAIENRMIAAECFI